MTYEDFVDLTVQMKKMGVLFFEFGGNKVAFNERDSGSSVGPLFADQQTMLDELMHGEHEDTEGRPASDGNFTDEDLFGSSAG